MGPEPGFASQLKCGASPDPNSLLVTCRVAVLIAPGPFEVVLSLSHYLNNINRHF